MAAPKAAKPLADISILDRIILKDVTVILTAADRVIDTASQGVVVDDPVVSRGSDTLGDYGSTTYSFKEKHTDRMGRVWDKAVAQIDVKTYPDLALAVVSTSSKVDWGEMVPEGAVRIEFRSIPNLKNLLGLYMFSDWWSRPHFDTDLAKLPNRTQFLLWQTKKGEYGCIVPLVSGGYKCDLNTRTGRPGADLTSFDSGRGGCDAAAFVVGIGEDPYELVQRSFMVGMAASGQPGKLRWEKPYPEIFEYIGWCTWDALYQNQNEKDILTKLKAYKKAKFPMRFLLIDDGWTPVDGNRMLEFDVDKNKFPRGLAPLVEDAREKYGIYWVGLWHTFNGWWGGISKGSKAYTQSRDHLFENKRGSIIPYPDANKGFGFWNTWHAWMRSQGVSFVKVDNQGSLASNIRHSMPIGDAAKGEQYGLQASVDLNLNATMVNCMCMTNEMAWHWINSNISRNSDDFFPKNPASAGEHALQNCYNNLMYGNLTWPDWDMWWSDHPRAKYHAAMRAVSGGPVYVSDPIDTSDFDVLWPLVFSDGRLLRCDEPALPTQDCLFANPRENPVPLKVFNSVGEAGIIGAFNATDGEVTVKGQIRPSDVEGIEAERFAVREFFSGETRVLGLNEAWEIELEPYGQKLFTLVPVDDGVAVIGLVNKYISPAAVDSEFRNEDTLAIQLHEGGDFLMYLEMEPSSVAVDGAKAKYVYENNWLSLKCKPGHHVTIEIGL